MKKLIFLEPVFRSMIWGGTRLKKEYGYNIPSDHTGECWAISAHKNGDCKIKNGEYKDKTLSWLWDNHRELFGNSEGEVFPLLVKIIDAEADLSIQVHPGDEYATVNENGALGKTESWYILDCKENANIIIGHNAKDKNELKDMIYNNRWEELIQVMPVEKGDFFHIEPGTVHAIKAGTMLLETQQNSDITYRLYDYNRLDNNKPRELHIEKSIDVIHCPQAIKKNEERLTHNEAAEIEELIHCKYYTVLKIHVHGEGDFKISNKFMNVSVIQGNGLIDGYPIKKGDHFIIPSGYGTYHMEGDTELIISHI